MVSTNEIVVIDYDTDDLEMIRDILKELGYNNKIVCFDDSSAAFDYLAEPETWPFIIICELNMPLVSGTELRAMILADPVINLKSIPFIFFTTIKSNDTVVEAYKGYIQGYFRKSKTYSDYTQTIKGIMDYWTTSLTPEHG